MIFKNKNVRAIANMVIGDTDYFKYRSSFYITQFFEDCDLDFQHDGTTRWSWTFDRLVELLAEPQSTPNALPDNFMTVLRNLMDKGDVADGDDSERSNALATINSTLRREGFEGFYGKDHFFHIRHIETNIVSEISNPHRPLTPKEQAKREQLAQYLDQCSEDDLIELIIMPLFRQLGYHRITAAGHKDKALEYGKDIWMKFTLPSLHVLYFGIQAKKGKLDSAGVTKGSNSNVSEIYNQVLMMLGHEIFDPETSKKALVDHAFIVSGGEITKQARNWLGNKLDATKRSQIMFMDRDDILDLYTVSSLPLPVEAIEESNNTDYDDVPF